MKKALIFCNHDATNVHPNGIRLINFAHMLKDIGYDAVVYGNAAKENHIVIQGVSCNEWEILKGHSIRLHFQRKNNFLNNIKNVLEENKDVKIVISAITSVEQRTHIFLRDYCKRNGILFVASIVEWYNIHNFGYKYFYRFLVNECTMAVDHKNDKNIIAISTYLADYYKKHKCNSLYIPTIIDKEQYDDCVYKKNDRLTIMYAGSPGKKDCILNAIYALGQLSDEELKKIRFVIFGVTESKLKQLGLTDEFLNKVGDALEIRGRIPQEEVKGNIASADYTVLLRKNTRNANAGFSTKVGESMACGTPVIANYTGDLDKYIFDEKTGLVCPDESIESCASVYRKALALTEEQYMNMRENAQKTAFECFDYREYTDLLKEFIKKAKR